MKIEEHFKNRADATRSLRSKADNIKKLAYNLKTAKNVNEFATSLGLLRALSLQTFEECDKIIK